MENPGSRSGAVKNCKIKIVIVTENEPFYLAASFRYFFEQIPEEYEVVHAVILKYRNGKSGFSSRINVFTIIRILGLSVLARGIYRFLAGSLCRSNRVAAIFDDYGISSLKGAEDINSPEMLSHLEKFNPDLIISVGVNSLFLQALQNLPRIGCINVHTGSRQEHRGKAAVFWALADGCTETGVTVHRIDDSIDAGKIISTRRYAINDRSFDRLLHDLRFLGMDALIEALMLIHGGNLCVATEQPPTKRVSRRVPCITDLEKFAQSGNSFF